WQVAADAGAAGGGDPPDVAAEWHGDAQAEFGSLPVADAAERIAGVGVFERKGHALGGRERGVAAVVLARERDTGVGRFRFRQQWRTHVDAHLALVVEVADARLCVAPGI